MPETEYENTGKTFIISFQIIYAAYQLASTNMILTEPIA